MEIEHVFLAGMLLFSFSSLYFMFTFKKQFNTAFFVSFITLISYVIMYSSVYKLGDGDNAIYYTRWFFYAFSCTLLIYEMSKMLKHNSQELLNMIYLTAIVMITGMFAALFEGVEKAIFFAISSLAFILLAKELLVTKSKEIDRSINKQIQLYILLGWSAFPLIFLISPAVFGLVTAIVAQGMYLVLDFSTKVVFYITTRKEEK